MQHSATDISAILAKADIKPSVQRIAVLRYLLENKCHPTVDDIYRSLSVEMPSLSRTTVYNTLWLLAERGAILSLDIERGNTHFDYAECPHAHFRCNKCGAIYDIPLTHTCVGLSDARFHVDSINVYYTGTCKKCFNPNSKIKIQNNQH